MSSIRLKSSFEEKSLRVNARFRLPIFLFEVCGLSAKVETIEERKAEVLIKLRKYKLIEKQKHEGAFAYIIDIPQDKEKAIVWCILGEATVGIAAMNTLYKVMKEKDIDRAIVVTEGRYTHAVKLGAKKKKVELLPKSFPVFDIFEHALVPFHEILSEKEKNQLLAQFKVQPYQMPQIKSGDPAVKAIGAKPGDVLKITRKSSTAGEHVTYRYVVE
jgi:DNA-directed RNA polymerase subunit H